MKRLLSGMRPTGSLHLGHLVGALDNWVRLQKQYKCFYMVADWHAFMSEYEKPKEIEQNVLEMVADWISSGIDPEKSTIFIQSHVKEHLELYMALGCLTPLSWLERNPTYKEQLREIKGRDLTTFGFLGYPVLQAADILLYKAEVVPVGMDQKAHLELTREIVRRFNRFYGNILPEPETLLTETPKLLGVDSRKMSKSFNNFIALSDKPVDIKKKVMQMITDPEKIRLADAGHPDICSIFSYYKVFAPDKAEDVSKACRASERGCIKCKEELSERLIERLAPVQKKRKELLKDKSALLDIIKKGNKEASFAARETMSVIKKQIGVFHDL